MIGALRPHGWLLVEEPDFVTPFHACPSETVCKVVTAGIRAMERLTGAQSEYGRHLFQDVCERALVDIEAFGRVLMMRGGSALCAHLGLSIAKVSAALVGSGRVTTEEVEEALARLNDPAFTMMSTITMAVWGRRAVVK